MHLVTSTRCFTSATMCGLMYPDLKIPNSNNCYCNQIPLRLYTTVTFFSCFFAGNTGKTLSRDLYTVEEK